MKKIVLLIMGISFALSTRAQDTCNQAMSISSGLYTVSAVDGSEVPSPICAANGTGATAGEWYSYTPTQDYYVTITTDLAQNSGGDTRFHVYTGDCGNLTCYAGDDDGGDIGNGYLSIDEFNVTAGITYIIAFDNKWNSGGFDFQLIESDPPPPPPISFTQQSLPTSGSYDGVIDMNGDYLDDVISVSNTNINIHYQNSSGFTESNVTTSSADFLPTWSMAGADYNEDGFTDLLYGSGTGVTFMRSNGDGTFTEVSGSEYVFSQRSNFVDINNDGHLDAFVCHDVDPNVYYLNDGSGNLTFHQGADPTGVPSGLGLHTEGGNYGTIWIDFDNDHDVDLFIAKCRDGTSTAKINELWRNNGDNTFTNIAGDTGVNMADPVQTWSSAWGDFNNDGYMDAFIGANSFSDGSHKLMLNNGDGTFSDVTASSGLSSYANSGRENVAHDFDNDGFIDIASNGDILLNNGDMTFTVYSDLLPNNNGSFGDLNNDGFMDSYASDNIYFNSANTNNWIKIVTIGTNSNLSGIGARVEIQTVAGTQIRDVRSGDGFANMSTFYTHFGIGTETSITSLTVYWPSGTIDTLSNPSINSTLTVTEGETLSLEEYTVSNLITYPNPTSDFINLNLSNIEINTVYSIFDVNGKRVMNSYLNSNSINVTNLPSGNYILRIYANGKQQAQRFIKN